MYQMRIYTIATSEAATQYATVCWEKHIKSLAAFEIHTEKVFIEKSSEEPVRVIALVRYEGSRDLAEVNAEYMQSDAFKADMQGFDKKNILKVEEITLDQLAF